MQIHDQTPYPTRSPLLVLVLAGCVSASTGWACAATQDGSEAAEESSSNGSGGGGVGGEATSASTGTGNLDVDGGTGGAEGCVAELVEAEPIPLDILVLLDESESMAGAKWDGSAAALQNFVNDPASAGIAVGLAVFPTPGSGPAVCDESNYQQLLVPIDALPANAPTLVLAIDAEDPQGSTTPLPSALEGGLSVAMAHKDKNPDHKVIVVLATDGKPTCVTNTNIDMAQAAADALAYNGVETYTIAIQGSDIAQLDDIAKGGGTGQAYDVTANIQGFAQKMADIRLKALPCEVVIPPPPMGEQLDPDMVNVKYTPGGKSVAETIPFAGTAAGCLGDPGWYYDDPVTPTKVLFCPATCTEVTADSGAKIDVAFGCKTDLK